MWGTKKQLTVSAVIGGTQVPLVPIISWSDHWHTYIKPKSPSKVKIIEVMSSESEDESDNQKKDNPACCKTPLFLIINHPWVAQRKFDSCSLILQSEQWPSWRCWGWLSCFLCNSCKVMLQVTNFFTFFKLFFFTFLANWYASIFLHLGHSTICSYSVGSVFKQMCRYPFNCGFRVQE